MADRYALGLISGLAAVCRSERGRCNARMCGKEWAGLPSLFSKHYFHMSVSFEKAGYSLIEYRQMAIYYTVGSAGQNSDMEMETPLFDLIYLL